MLPHFDFQYFSKRKKPRPQQAGAGGGAGLAKKELAEAVREGRVRERLVALMEYTDPELLLALQHLPVASHPQCLH
jgi:hypothetical protein